MATTQNRQDFISRTRRLAADFIRASDTFNALAAELTYLDLALAAEVGGLSVDDFLTLNADLTPEKLLAFYAVLGALLAPLTVEQKKVIYAAKGSSQNILPPGV
jgi:hypothetical protein